MYVLRDASHTNHRPYYLRMTLFALDPISKIANSPNYKWWVYCAVAAGMFTSVMDQSGTNIALPAIADHFLLDIPTVQWVTLSYILATSALFMPAGRLSDIVGRKYVFMGGLAIFAGAAVVGGLSTSFPMLLGAKILQGVASAGIGANGMAMVAEIFPDKERGKALGLYMTIIGTGVILGPVVGGVLVGSLGWRAVFFAVVPMGLLALVAASLVLRKTTRATSENKSLSFDWGGAGMSSGALVAFLLSLTNAHRFGWDSPLIVGGFVLAVALVIGFLWWEKHAPDPMLDLAFFKMHAFSMGVAARFSSFLGSSSVFFLMPFFLVQALHYSPSKAGIFMVPSAIGMAVMGPISGQLSDKLGTRWLSVIGMGISTCAFIVFTRMTVDASPGHVLLGMTLQGIGMGIFSSPNTSSIMSSVSKANYGIASAFLNTTRTSANLSGVALATTIVTITMGVMGFEPSLSAVSAGGGDGVRISFVTGLSRAFILGGAFVFLSSAISAVGSRRLEDDRP